jgi:non-ribosomal peptide synthetase-like protein
LPTLLHEYFARAVARWPDEVALDIPPGPDRPARATLTYATLDAWAAAVAARLAASAAPDAVVAVLVRRDSPWLLASQLGVLRAGAAFTCLEPSFPDAQLAALVTEASPVAIVADEAGAARLAALGLTVDVVVGDGRCPEAHQSGAVVARPGPTIDASALAYVIYTSGTSGQPKGVEIEHRSIANLVQADLDEFGLGPGDRVAQGSSAAYDSSIEETWLALAAGATLVVADDAVVRLGPDLVPWLAGERITVFCPPPTLLRATGCADPAAALPALRLLYVGGEALPDDVAERWSRGRTMVNGYGPTEATVTVVRERVIPGAAVAIGRPIAGVAAWVLDAAGHDAGDDVPGELCLGGVALARGYRRQPALTADRFPVHPTHGRLYRTGDRVSRAADGRLVYLGRLDAQVKLRGYRIELEAIEARLAAQPGVAQAAAAVQGTGTAQRLVAVVVPSAGMAVDGAALVAALRAELPPYMVPSRLGVVDRLPTSVGGKLDRAALPVLGDETRPVARTLVVPRTADEAAIATAMQQALQRSDAVSVDDDFFADLGGDSLAVGLLVSRLRERPETHRLTTRDVYDARTVAGLASRAGVAPGDAATAAPPPPRTLPSRARMAGAATVQAAWIAGELAMVSGLVTAMLWGPWTWLDDHVGLSGLVIATALVLGGARLSWTPVAVALTAVATRVLLPSPTPGRYPAWGSVHLRVWILQRLAATIPWDALAGTHGMSVALRALGARVGHHVHVARGAQLPHGVWSLLDLGDRVSLARDASLRAVDLDDGQIVIGRVRVEADATLDVHAGVAPGASIGAGATVGPWASIGPGDHVPAGERWEGVPARRAGRTPPLPVVASASLGAWTHAAVTGLARTAARGVFWGPAAIAVLAVFASADLHSVAELRARLWSPAVWGLAAIACVAALATALALAGLVCRWLPREAAATVPARSWTAVRIDLKTHLLDGASRWLSGSLAWPAWLRLAGMRVGGQVEVSAIMDTVPDLVTIGAGTFLADGLYLAAPRVDRGTLTTAPVTLGARVFLGNHAVLGPGVTLPDDTLLGVCTVATPAMADASGAAWFGHPPMPLARPAAVIDPGGTYRPSPIRLVNRWLWEGARVLLPLGLVAVGAAWLEAVLGLAATGVTRVAGVAAVTAAAALALAVACVALKWLLLGRVRPGAHVLWSCWCSRWDFMYVAWSLYVPWFVAPLEGTPWLAWYLRALGMRIGRGVLLGRGFADVVDPDMVTIGDGATVQALFQAHTFEDRLLKMGPVVVGAGATVAAGVVPLYGATVGEGAHVAAHSVVMKGETLTAHTAYAGSPVAQM